MKAVFLFPGQGSQEIGMGRDLFRADPRFRNLIRLASELAGEDLERVCLKGPDRELRRASRVQPLLVCVSLGYLAQLDRSGLRAEAVLGHSLGEIAALAAAGVVPAEEAVRIAAKRGALMEEAAQAFDGGMIAVNGSSRETVERLLERAGAPGALTLANDNAPAQVVVSGERTALDALRVLVAAERAGRCVPLPVSGPWHSPRLAPAAEAFARSLEAVAFHPPTLPLVLNATGRPESDPVRIKARVAGQLAAPVLWRPCMDYVRTLGADALFEVGPGRVLSGLARLNGFPDAVRVRPVNSLRAVEQAAREFVRA